MVYRDDFIHQDFLSSDKFKIVFKQNFYYIISNNKETTTLFRLFSQNTDNKDMIRYLLDNNYKIYLFKIPVQDFDFYYYNELTKESYYFKIKKEVVENEEGKGINFNTSKRTIKRISRFIQRKNR